MTNHIGKQPVTTLEVTQTDLKTGTDKGKLKQFNCTITQISGLVSYTSPDSLLSPTQR